MLRYVPLLAVVSAYVAVGLAQAPAARPDREALTEALAQVGLTLDTGKVDPRHKLLQAQAEHCLPLYDVLQSDPYGAMDWTRVLGRGQVQAGTGLLVEALGQAGARQGLQVRRGWIDDPFEGLAAKLGADPAAVIAESTGADPAAVREAVAAAPTVVVRAAARILAATASAVKFRRLAFEGLHSISEADLFASVAADWSGEPGGPPPSRALDAHVWHAYGEVDWSYLLCGAEDLALQIDAAVAELKAAPPAGEFLAGLTTPLGTVMLAGTQANQHAEDALLIIDRGGDDTYSAGAGARGTGRPVSVVIDLAGNDTYASAEGFRFGGALGGYAFLWDTAGNDTYACPRGTEGAGVFGVGVLLDESGDDTYDSERVSQGAAVGGIGLLIDRAGDDRYHCFENAQGFGATRGTGLLTDVSGSDNYVADDTTIKNPSAQTAEHNNSMAQGAGEGPRRDYIDGHSLAGGFGGLADGGGNDTYTCGVFGQGVGYWYGIGLLADLGGDDSYSGVWYTQGSAAHSAIGILGDAAGNDAYKATQNMAIGAGHDYSLGILLEDDGDDTYDAPNLSLGGGNANGMGLFVDRNGNDTYRVSAATTFGRANIGTRGGQRDLMLCLGVFADLGGGEDTYPEAFPFARNGAMWSQPGTDTEHPLGTEVGVGIDR